MLKSACWFSTAFSLEILHGHLILIYIILDFPANINWYLNVVCMVNQNDLNNSSIFHLSVQLCDFLHWKDDLNLLVIGDRHWIGLTEGEHVWPIRAQYYTDWPIRAHLTGARAALSHGGRRHIPDTPRRCWPSWSRVCSGGRGETGPGGHRCGRGHSPMSWGRRSMTSTCPSVLMMPGCMDWRGWAARHHRCQGSSPRSHCHLHSSHTHCPVQWC